MAMTGLECKCELLWDELRGGTMAGSGDARLLNATASPIVSRLTVALSFVNNN